MKTAEQMSAADLPARFHRDPGAPAWLTTRAGSGYVQIALRGEEGVDLAGLDSYGCQLWQAHFSGGTPADIVTAALKVACE